MKIKLNIKNKPKVNLSKNIIILLFFTLTLTISLIWIKMINTQHKTYTQKIQTLKLQISTFKSNLSTKKNETIDSKQYINITTLEKINQKIKIYEKLLFKDNYLYLFFDYIEKSANNNVFIKNISNNLNKKSEFTIEGISLNADNVNKFIKNLKEKNFFTNINLLSINNNNNLVNHMNFKILIDLSNTNIDVYFNNQTNEIILKNKIKF